MTGFTLTQHGRFKGVRHITLDGRMVGSAEQMCGGSMVFVRFPGFHGAMHCSDFDGALRDAERCLAQRLADEATGKTDADHQREMFAFLGIGHLLDATA